MRLEKKLRSSRCASTQFLVASVKGHPFFSWDLFLSLSCAVIFNQLMTPLDYSSRHWSSKCASINPKLNFAGLWRKIREIKVKNKKLVKPFNVISCLFSDRREFVKFNRKLEKSKKRSVNLRRKFWCLLIYEPLLLDRCLFATPRYHPSFGYFSTVI